MPFLYSLKNARYLFIYFYNKREGGTTVRATRRKPQAADQDGYGVRERPRQKDFFKQKDDISCTILVAHANFGTDERLAGLECLTDGERRHDSPRSQLKTQEQLGEQGR